MAEHADGESVDEVVVQVEDQADSLRIVISDRGPGIPQEQLEQVMEPFYRVEGSRNAETGGYGLGLSIAHTIARAHEGRLSLSNREGGTTTSTCAAGARAPPPGPRN